MNLSLLTYNIHKGFSSYNRQFVLHEVREQLRSLDVDVVLLQEVVGEHSGNANSVEQWPESSQFEFLADQVWPHYAYAKNAIGDGRHHGNATLSKYPFAQWDNINVSPFKRASRSLLHGDITIPDTDKTIHIINLHLGLLGLERKRQINSLNQHIESVINNRDAVLIGGDFNDWSGRQVSRLLRKDFGLQEAFLIKEQRFARTFPARWPLFMMDRIYFSGMSLESCERLHNSDWHKLSDHIPLLAHFTL